MTKSLTINLTNSAAAVVTLASKADKIVYSAYIAEHDVTLDTVSDHVATLADLAVSMKAVNAEDKDAMKCFKNRVRNGLNRNLGKGKAESTSPTALITALGATSTLEEVTAAWHAAQK